MLALSLFALALSTIHLGPEAPLGHAATGNVVQSQWTPRLATGPAPLAVWREPDLTGELVGSGRPETLQAVPVSAVKPAVARGRASYLVPWLSWGGSGLRIEAKRLAFDGTPIDAQPLELAREGGNYSEFTDWPAPSVAYDGTNFLVVWTTIDSEVRAVRVSPDGLPLDAQPITVGSYPDHSGGPVSIRVVWSGSVYVVGWIFRPITSPVITQPPPPPVSLSIVRVGVDGHVLDSEPSVIAQQASSDSLALAANGSEVLAIWNGDTCISGATLHNDGTLLAAARPLSCGGTAYDLDLAWNGAEYIAVWEDSNAGAVEAQRFDAAMTPLDDEPFAVNPPGSRASMPAVAASGAGASIAYSRHTDETQSGGLPRAFVRTLERLEHIPRPRPARR